MVFNDFAVLDGCKNVEESYGEICVHCNKCGRFKSEWKVTSNTINGKKMYAVYRLRDINAVDHSGNREFAGSYVNDRDAAVIIAKELNKQEENHETN